MRKLLSVAAIVVAALGLVWMVRLGARSASPAADELAARPAGPDDSVPMVANSERRAEKPAPTLGRIGGTLPKTLIDPRLLAEKSRRTLTVFSDGRPVKTYRTALGQASIGDKVREGDGRTPQGTFYVCVKNPQSRYHLALGLSYPSADDAERGVRERLITKREQRGIVEAIQHYRQPPWNTKLGGEIMIHGGGTATDWTTGCVALSNPDIEELYPLIPLGTPVEIRP